MRGVDYEIDKENGILSYSIPATDKTSEIPLAKFLLKVGIESLYTSKRAIFKKYDFTLLKKYLRKEDNNNWSYLTSQHFKDGPFYDIPEGLDKKELDKIKTSIQYREISHDTLLIRFKYISYTFIINILSRNTSWMNVYKEGDPKSYLYPKYMEAKYNKEGKI